MSLLEPSQIEAARSIDCRVLLATAIQIKRKGADMVSLCPFHVEKSPSFHVYENGFHCFGCGASGTAIDWIMLHEQLPFPAAVRRLLGLPDPDGVIREPIAAPPIQRAPNASPFDDKMIEDVAAARALWDQAGPPSTLVSKYLALRGIKSVSQEIRFLRELMSYDQGRALPCMIAAVRDRNGSVTGLQRTWIDPETAKRSGKRKTLGVVGAGAIRLSSPLDALGIAEGVEKALACIQIYRVPTWAALGTRADKVAIPTGVRKLILFGDNDARGREAVDKARFVHKARGLDVIAHFPPAEFKDFDQWTANQTDDTDGSR